MLSRLAVAILPPERICDDLSGVCSGLPQARWIDAQNLYLPLQLIDLTLNNLFIEDLLQSLEGVESEPLRLRFSGIRYKKKGHGNGELSLALEESTAVDQLRQRVRSALRELPFESRKLAQMPKIFLAHLEKGSDRRVAEFMQLHANYHSPWFDIQELYLLNLSSRGSQPRILARIPLGPKTTSHREVSPPQELPSYWRRAWLPFPSGSS